MPHARVTIKLVRANGFAANLRPPLKYLACLYPSPWHIAILVFHPIYRLSVLLHESDQRRVQHVDSSLAQIM